MSWALAVNPVLERELRQRFRSRSAWIVLTLYLAALAVILRLVYDIGSRSDALVPLSQAQTAATAGRSIFHWLLFFMLGLICFIVPGLTAAAIAGERERQTLVPLQVTLLRARAIVVGKVLASLAFVVLLLVAALPLLSVSFLLGGVDIPEVAKGMGMLLAVAVAVACLSMGCSSVFRRTQTATVTAYALVAALVIGTPVVYAAQRTLDTRATGTTTPTVLVLNPFAATAEVVRGRTGANPRLSSPFSGIQNLLERDVFTDRAAVTTDVIRGAPSDFGPVPALPPPPGVTGPRQIINTPDGPIVVDPRTGNVIAQPGQARGFQEVGRRPKVAGLPFWAASLVSFAGLGVLGLLLAAWRVRLPAHGGAE